MSDDIDIEQVRAFAREVAIDNIRNSQYDQVFALETIGYLLFDISESLRALVAPLGSSATSTRLSDAAPTAEALALLMRATQAHEITRQGSEQQ